MIESARVLLVEDEEDIRELIKLQLSKMGLEIDTVSNALSALQAISKHQTYELFILDWMLPGTSGLELCKKLRQQAQTKTTPILMVTALERPENIISGLDAGADDYITKPFDIDILKARVRAQLRRFEKSNSPENIITRPNFHLDIPKCIVKINEQAVHLTSTEFKILALLAQSPGHVFTREQMIQKILGNNVHVTNRTIDTHMAGLRKKLGKNFPYVETIRGIGYRFQDE